MNTVAKKKPSRKTTVAKTTTQQNKTVKSRLPKSKQTPSKPNQQNKTVKSRQPPSKPNQQNKTVKSRVSKTKKSLSKRKKRSRSPNLINTNIPQPKKNKPTPKTNIPQPKKNKPTPKTNIPQPKTNIPQPKTNIPTPKTNKRPRSPTLIDTNITQINKKKGKINEEIYDIKELEASDPVFKGKILDLKDLITLKANDAFEWVYKINPKVGITYKDRPPISFTNSRDWWEPSSPTTQCDNTTGKKDPNLICYICGLKLGEDDPQFSAECEHILPVFLGSLLLTLYKAKKRNTLFPVPANEFTMEYAWAHRCCNQVKSDSSLINYDKRSETFGFNNINCEKILKGMLTGSQTYCVSLKKAIKDKMKKNGVKESNWITQRMDEINQSQIKPICDYLNKIIKDNGIGIFYLSILSSLVSSADLQLISLSQQKINNIPFIPSAPKGELIIKAAVYENFSHEMTTFLRENIFVDKTLYQMLKTKTYELNFLIKSLFFYISPREDINSFLKTEPPFISRNEINFKTTFTYIINSILREELQNKHASFKTSFYQNKPVPLHLNSIFRDMFSLFVFSNFTRSDGDLLNSFTGKFGNNFIESSEICKCFLRILLYSLVFFNLTNLKETPYLLSSLFTSSRTSSRATNIMNNIDIIYTVFREFIKGKIQAEIDNLFSTFVNPDEEKLFILVIGILYSVISSFTTTITSNDINTNNIFYDILFNNKNLMNEIESQPIVNESIQKIMNNDNLLFCKVEYYKKYMDEYQDFVKINQEDITNEDLEVSAAIALSQMHNTIIPEKELDELVDITSNIYKKNEDLLNKMKEIEIINE